MAMAGVPDVWSWLEMITTALQQKEKITGVMTMSRLVVVSNRMHHQMSTPPVPVA